MKNSTNPGLSPPEGLSPAARAWWQRLHDEYDLTDQAARFLLETALRAFDRMHEAAAKIAEHGVVVTDKFGQLKSNPATTVERDSRAAMLGAFRQLGLEVTPPSAGRAGGR